VPVAHAKPWGVGAELLAEDGQEGAREGISVRAWEVLQVVQAVGKVFEALRGGVLAGSVI
jgi:hypothetical protein